MRWQGEAQSENVEDRRGMSMGGGQMMMGGGLGTLVLLLLVWLLGGDPLALLQQMNQGAVPPQAGPMVPGGPVPGGPQAGPEVHDRDREFVAVVLRDTEDVWKEQFRAKIGRQYREPHLVMFSDATQSACGFAQSATGPFYCPEDQRVYLDTSFFRELDHRFHAPGDFAKAYVIAHEVGHHVQNLLGWSEQIQAAERRAGKRECEQAVGAARVASRLFGRRLGLSREPHEAHLGSRRC